MIEFKTPANTSEALSILRAMREVVIPNQGGADLRPAEVIATIGDSFLFYTKEYCAMAQQRDGLFAGYDFNKGAPFWLEDMASGNLTPINAMSVGAQQLVEAVQQVR